MNLREELAELEHIQWSHWEKYRQERLYELSEINSISFDKHNEQITNWKRLRNTDYKDLTEKEKESDRNWADKVIIIHNKWKEQARQELIEEIDELYVQKKRLTRGHVKEIINEVLGESSFPLGKNDKQDTGNPGKIN